MKKTLLIPAMISLTFSAMAKDLSDYRKDIGLTPAQLQQSQSASAKTVQSILGKLSAQSAVDSDLISNANNKSLEAAPRISFGNSLKRFLDLNSGVLKRDQEFERPTTVNPKWSPEQSQQMKIERRNYVCKYVLKNFNMPELLVNLEDESLAQKAKRNGLKADARQAKSLESLNALLDSMNSGSRRSASQALGKAVHFDVRNGVISEIHLSDSKTTLNDLNTVSLSLPMLVNARTQKDDYFVEAASCLQDYLKEQLDTLEVRQSELNGGVAALKVRKAELQVAARYEFYSRTHDGVQLTKDAFFRNEYLEMASDDAAAAYLLKRDQYLLGKNLSKASEMDLNKKRIGTLKVIMPYLKAKVAGANRTNVLLKSLSTAQVDQLISLMLQLRGEDIPTTFDIDKMIDLAMAKNDKSMNAEVLEYQILLQALTALQMKMSEPIILI